MNNYSHRILKTEYSKDTGVIIDQAKFKKINKSRGGWRRMYKDYTSAQESCIKGLSDLKIWNYMIEHTKSDFSILFNATNVSKKLGMSRQTVHGFIRRAIEQNVIKKIEDRVYEFNPFIYCPFGANDEIVSQKQEEWKEYK